MATITSTELQEATEAAEEQLAELMDEETAATYWQERLDTATGLIEELAAPAPKGKRTPLTRRAGAAGRAEAAKRFPAK